MSPRRKHDHFEPASAESHGWSYADYETREVPAGLPGSSERPWRPGDMLPDQAEAAALSKVLLEAYRLSWHADAAVHVVRLGMTLTCVPVASAAVRQVDEEQILATVQIRSRYDKSGRKLPPMR